MVAGCHGGCSGYGDLGAASIALEEEDERKKDHQQQRKHSVGHMALPTIFMMAAMGFGYTPASSQDPSGDDDVQREVSGAGRRLCCYITSSLFRRPGFDFQKLHSGCNSSSRRSAALF